MSLILTAIVCLTMVGTAFLSGIFGMAGGLILMGVLLVIMPVPDAMMLHGVTQMASNGWRGLLWIKHVRWSAMASYLAGGAAAAGGDERRAVSHLGEPADHHHCLLLHRLWQLVVAVTPFPDVKGDANA